ncbi:MAG: serine hydrolase [Actinobacteria bacterium]|nr:serine hydrolase [Actinomycetota bacterium]
MPTPVHGICDAAFHAVRDAFNNNFSEHGEIGASVCITVNGAKVVDLWGGFSNPEKTHLWQEDQLVNAFSIGKGITAVVAAQCVALGFISYDTRVASVWPEFAVNGKETLTLRDLLGHRAGLPAVRTRLPANSMFNWKLMTESLAAETPWWIPGQAHGYHVNTYGFLVGEVLRRTTGKTVGQLITEMIAAPLNAEIYLGTPAHLHSRIADYEWPSDPFPEEEPAGLDEEQLVQFNTYSNPSGLSGAGVVNTAPWRLAEMPSTNVHASARAISTLYTSLAHGGTHHNVTLLPSAVLDITSSEVSMGDDRILHRVSRFAHGFQLPIPERGFGPNTESFGHFGAGGSVGFCDPKVKVGFGYVMNQMGPRWQNPRNRALIESLYSVLQ